MYTLYHKYANLFLSTPKNIKPAHLCMPFSSLHIALCQLSVLAFPYFFKHTIRIVLFCGMFSSLEIEKSLTLTCIKLCVTGIWLRGGCKTLSANIQDVALCENLRYWEWSWIICICKYDQS